MISEGMFFDGGVFCYQILPKDLVGFVTCLEGFENVGLYY